MRKGVGPVLQALAIAAVAGIVLGLGWYVAVAYSSQKAYTPDNLIRLHIVPNSDSELDQELKLSVRDRLLREIAPELTPGHGGSPLVRLEELLPTVDAVAREVARSAGVDYGVYSEIGIYRFPSVSYTAGTRQIMLPSGKYLALRVVLGEGKGRNWWCVIFPPLCYLDVAVRQQAPPDITSMARDELERLCQRAVADEHAPTEVRFFLAEVLKSGWEKIAAAISRWHGRVLLCPAP
ncbi:MAG: stage II sporulation protein R [Firmicutes bacterium]|nr:stage II sporulation protein R [Candidatus Fermentithermobacillaceae bacterium]